MKQVATHTQSTTAVPTRKAPTKKLAALGMLMALGLAACGGSDPAPASAPANPAAAPAAAPAAPAAQAAATPTTAAPAKAPGGGYGTPSSVAAATPATAPAAAATPTTAAAAKQPSLVSVQASSLGQILADAQGMTLYGFTDDANGQPTCAAACAKAWPPLTVDASFDVSGLPASGAFSVVARPDGTSQLKSGKWPLYYFAGDGAVGDVNGQASGGKWFVVGPDGVLVK